MNGDTAKTNAQCSRLVVSLLVSVLATGGTVGGCVPDKVSVPQDVAGDAAADSDGLGACSPDCTGKECGDSDGCKGICRIDVSCQDENQCTEDTCTAEGKCQHLPVDGDCEDGNLCTGPDLCQDGKCVAGAAVDCSDSDPCTSDSCSPLVGCQYKPQTGECDDTNQCTIGDHCLDGVCKPGSTPLDCNDGKDCTTDACEAATGCTHQPKSEGPCDDGDSCTTSDSCDNGQCVGKPVDVADFCDDYNYCTKDTCDSLTGCAHEALNGAPCDDGMVVH